jgi:hypothetical protein
MDGSQRREEILKILKQSNSPVSASMIAKKFKVSRQVIVGDIALLRAANAEISATPRGYILADENNNSPFLKKTIACRHSYKNMAEELYAIVDNGCGIIDVIVEHAVYGQISAQLQIFSRFDADCFIKKLSNNNALPLCDLTEGVHLHTISCESEEAYKRVTEVLNDKGILFVK